MRLINEGLQNKIQIYAERLERQDKLISRLEQEIIHADEQCQEFLLYWSPHSGLKLNGEVRIYISYFSSLVEPLK